MPRQGRALELLIQRLEVVASAGEADIRSPDYVTGRNSESRREVDVAVRSMVGSAKVFVMFECRDRAGNEDVRWIEEIASKRDDVGANVAVAVTSAGFTTGAQNTARRLGIELRVVEDITVSDVVSWCRLQHLDVKLVESRAATFDVRTFADMPPLAPSLPFHRLESLTDVPLDIPIFTLWDARNSPPPSEPQWGTAKQLYDLAFDALRHSPEFDLAQWSDWTDVRLPMSTQDTPTVAVNTVKGLFPLAHFEVIVQVRTVSTQVPVTIREVTDDRGRSMQVAEAVVEYGGQRCTVSLVKSDDGLAIMMETDGPVDA